jgi:putative salt-induced outer membrane protein YdiY
MNKKSILFLGLITSTLFTGANSAFAIDRLFLKNGDKLSGEITSYNTETVSIETAYGDFNVPTYEIGGVASPGLSMDDLMNPSIIPDQTVQLTAPTPPQPIETEPSQTTPAMATIPAPAIVETMDETSDPTLWGGKWSGNINVGGELETGNSDGKAASVDGETTINWDDIHRLSLSADYDWEEEDDVEVTDEREAAIGYDYFFAKKWFWNNQLSYQQDDIESLDMRIEATSGLGYQIFDQDDLTLEVTAGPGFEREEYEGQDAENNGTANWSLSYEQSFNDDFIRLFHDNEWVTPWDEFSSWIFESDSGVRIPLRENLVASGEVEFDYNNDPAPGEGEDDTTYAIKLGYEW